LKDFVPNDKAFMGRVRWKRHGNRYEVVHWRNHPDFNKGKGIGVQILENGTNIAKGNNSVQIFKQIPVVLGLSREEVRGAILLASDSTHVLLNGTNTERFQFLDGPFQLSKYTAIYAKIKEKLKSLDAGFQKLESVEATRKRAQEQLEEIGSIDTLREKHSTLEESHKSFRTKRKELRREYDRQTEAITLLTNIDKELVKEDAVALRSDLESSKDELDKLANRSAKAEQRYEEVKKNAHIKSQLAKMKHVKASKLAKEEERVLDQISTFRSNKSTASQTIKSLESISDESVCPTCQRPIKRIDARLFKEKIAEAQVALNQAKKDIESFSETLEDLRKEKSKAQEYVKLKAKLSESGTDLDKAKENMEKASKSIKKARSLYEKEQSHVADVESAHKQLKALKEMGIKASSKTLATLKEQKEQLHIRIETIEEKESTLTARIEKISNKIESYEAFQDEIKGYEDKLAETKKLSKQRRIYQGLEQAYGPRGLRLDRVRKITQAFQERLPRFTSELFTEKGIEFTVKSGEKELGFEVHRPGKEPLDIRGLSSGEAGRMNLALILMIRFSMPQEKVSNLMILDEVDRGVDKIGRLVLAKGLIPLLKNKTDTMFVISHNADVSSSPHFDQTWTVRKKSGRSSLVR